MAIRFRLMAHVFRTRETLLHTCAMRTGRFMIASLMVGATLLAACEPGPSAMTMQQFVVPEPYSINGPVVPVGNGAWFSLWAPAEFGTERPSGALGYVDAAGRMSVVPMTTSNSYPGALAVGSDGTLWYALTQGDGVARSTDTGPQLADVHGELGWRRPD